jgi:5-methylcytosine-specific restriction endonuclease McrA
MKLSDIKLTAIGDTIQMVGAVYAGEGESYICLFPEDAEAAKLHQHILEMDAEDWKVFLRQTDLMETEVLTRASDGTLAKAMLRKSSRSVEQVINWNCFRRDNYTCRYCGNNRIPLTVDHLVRWEEGGPSIEANMLSSCKKCNKTRGDKPYVLWLQHDYYLKVSRNLSEEVRAANLALVPTLTDIPRKYHVASR